MITLLAALTCLAPQDAGERRPVHADPTAQVEVSADTVVRLYDASGLTGHARLQKMVDAISEASSPDVVADVHQRLVDLHDHRAFIGGTVDNLLATLGDLIEPPLVEGTHRVFHVQNGTIALVGTNAQQQWLSDFLANASKFDGFIDVQARIFVFEKGQLDELNLSRSGQVLDATQTAQLLRKLEPRKFDHIEAPRVLVSPFQEAELVAVKQVAYIRDYELKVLADQDVEVADPIIDVAQGGIVMSLRGVPLANGRLSIEADLEYSKLTEPIATFETTIGAMGHPVTIQLPEITRVQVQGRFALFPGETLLMASVDPSATSEALVLVHATLVEAEEAR